MYRAKFNGRTFEIDGQTYEYNTREWRLSQINSPDTNTEDDCWIDTYATKAKALEAIPGLIAGQNYA